MRLLLSLCLMLACPIPGLAAPLVVFAASSLKAPLDEAAALHSAAGGGEVVISYGSSAALARQVEAGAPADMVVLAAPEWMDYLQERERIVPQTRHDLWGNSLSLVAHDPASAPVPLDGSVDLAGLIGEDRLAMALVDSVPLGRYGKQALQSIGQWQGLEPLVVQAEDARAAVGLVATGQAGFALVYGSDAVALIRLGQAVEIGRFADGTHDPIVYPAAVVAGTGQPAAAGAFLDFLQGAQADGIFAAHGYVMLGR